MIKTGELKALHDSCQGFYGKAKVIQSGYWMVLQSYGTNVCRINTNGEVILTVSYSDCSSTTLRHIKEFLLQCGKQADNKKQIFMEYGVDLKARDL